jgi:signal transduction histidine kinase
MNSIIHAYEKGDEGKITIDVSLEGDEVVIKYADDGKGIPKENLDKIFEPFFTTRRNQGGSGLGMHIVYNLVVQKLQGTIVCESEVGKGTSFTVKIPHESSDE